MKFKVIRGTPTKPFKPVTPGVIRVKSKPPRMDLKTSIVRFQAAMEQVKTVVLERDEEVAALSLCILTGQHMMLEGPHGIAKSLLAKEVTRRITGAILFSKQLMAGTNADEVFGPMNVKAYREEGRYEHNTEGYIPTAHFGFLDEVYRASASMLGSLMSMLNERIYHNGNIVVKCPLITAIGTTNFVTDTDELLAFHDRWLVKSKLKALTQPSLRRKMLTDFHARLVAEESDGDSPDELKTVPLADIQNIRAHLGEIEVAPEMVELFEELLRNVSKSIGGAFYLSDRRACLTFDMALMNSLVDRTNKDGMLKPEHLNVARYGIVPINDIALNQSFDQTYERIVGTYEKNAKEIRDAKITLDRARKMCGMYDENLVVTDQKKLYSRMDELVDSIEGMEEDDKPSLDSSRDIYDKCVSDLKSVMLEMEESPKMEKIVAEYKRRKGIELEEDSNLGQPVSAFGAEPVPDRDADDKVADDPGSNQAQALPKFKLPPKEQ